MKRSDLIISNFAIFLSLSLFSQQKINKSTSEYKFTITKNIESTPVQNQGLTNTCWAFSSLSFFEAELIRMGKAKELNLSEMFVVHEVYLLKALNYIRMHGNSQFTGGGEIHDALRVIREFGIVPEEVYNGKPNKDGFFNHTELDSVLRLQVRQTAISEKINLQEELKKIEITIENYLGKVPDVFNYKGKEYSAKTFSKDLGLNPDDYVFLTSFLHHDFYAPFVIEVPDNWDWQQAYNLPLDELKKIVEISINKGYGVAWTADVTEPYFRFKDGLAIVPEDWEKMTEIEKFSCFTRPVKQKTITPQNRQIEFDNFATQDDHAMHITGMANDQSGKKYYLVKNSWGKNTNECGGYFYASEEYFLLKTIFIMVHKDVIPVEVRKKLKI